MFRRLTSNAGLVDFTSIEEFHVRDSRKYYKPYLYCSDVVQLKSLSISLPDECMSVCDNEDACVGLYWEFIPTNTTEILSICYIYSKVKIEIKYASLSGVNITYIEVKSIDG